VIVGLAAGGPTDVTARIMAQWLSEHINQQFIVENRTGAGGSLATEVVINASPDGYTLLFSGPNVTIGACLYRRLSKTLEELAPISGVMRFPNLLVVAPSLPVKTVAELIDYAKAKNHGKDEQVRIISKKDVELKKWRLDEALLIGQHNQDNLALASALAMEAGWPSQAIQGMKRFQGLSHRLENLGETHGVRFINDSKATAMDSVLIAATAAFDTLAEGGKLFLLLGGRDKNLPWEQLNALASLKNVVFIFFGECREIAQKKSQLQGASFVKLSQALQHAFDQASSSDTVLLSPGGTSLDEFKSFEDRGNFFKKKIEEFASVVK